MLQSAQTKIYCLLLLAGLVSACASAPSGPEVKFDESALRSEDQDLIFATEYPVANKADALQRATEARNDGELDKALFLYVKALKFDPHDAELLARIGHTHQLQHNAPMAVRAFTLALQEKPDYVAVLEARGLLYFTFKEDARAADDLSRAVELNGGSSSVHNALGLLADRSGDHDTAQQHYSSALELNPGAAEILNNRGYSKFMSGDYEGSGRDLYEAAHTHGHKQAWVNLGAWYAHHGEYDLAIEALQNVLPGPEALNIVAEKSIQKGDYDTAEDLLQQAIRLSPTYFPAAEENLAKLRFETAGS